MKIKEIPAITRAQMIEVDRFMIEEFDITLLQMMENAGRNLAILARDILGGELRDKNITVLCGGGNNGGGGLAAARHLVNWGAGVLVCLAVPANKLKDTPAHQLRTLQRMKVPVSNSLPSGDTDLIIDALIGYGLRGEPRGKTAQWIQKANRAKVPILSLDIPSGLDADTGSPSGDCIRAHMTLTLALPKAGMRAAGAAQYLGDLYIGDIGVPPALLREIGIDSVHLFTSSPIVKIS